MSSLISSCAQLLRDQRCEPELPHANRLVGDDVATQQEELGDIAEAELVSQTPEHREEHHVGRVLQFVEGCAGALIEPATASSAREALVAKRRPLRPSVHGVRSAVRTAYGGSSSQPDETTPPNGPSNLTQPPHPTASYFMNMTSRPAPMSRPRLRVTPSWAAA